MPKRARRILRTIVAQFVAVEVVLSASRRCARNLAEEYPELAVPRDSLVVMGILSSLVESTNLMEIYSRVSKYRLMGSLESCSESDRGSDFWCRRSSSDGVISLRHLTCLSRATTSSTVQVKLHYIWPPRVPLVSNMALRVCLGLYYREQRC